MTDTIGRGVIEISADARKLKAGIEDAKKSIRTLGEGQKEIGRSAQVSIDKYIGKLQQQNATLGKSVRETELFKLALRGASNEQLRSADAALRIAEAHARSAKEIEALRTGFIRLGAVAGVALGAAIIGAAVGIDRLISKAANFQDLSEKIGDSAEAIASLAVAAATGGASMDTVAGGSAKLTKALTGVDDESEAAGAAIKALGLNLEAFKQLKAADQMESVAKALAQFEDGTQKTAVAMALFGKAGAELLPFLKELGKEGARQVILTEDQIQAADAYADAQAKLGAQIALQAQSMATELLPALTQVTHAFADLIKQEEVMATVSEALKSALSGAVVVFQTIAIVASDVGFVFLTVGRTIGATIAQIEALQRLDFSGFTAISRAVAEDSARARATLDKFQADVLKIGQPQPEFVGPQPKAAQLPKLNFSGAVKKPSGGADNSAEQEAKAQLAFDLDQIKKAGEASVAEFARAQNIMEAMRSANLVQDREYYASKLGFINLNSQAQEKALQQEIDRLQRETFVGKNAVKEKIDNDRKIADAQSRLDKVRADSAANREINSIQEVASFEALAKSQDRAKESTDAYIDSIMRRNAAEIAGVGRGNRFRQDQAAQLEIEQRFLDQRRKLEGELRRNEIKDDVFAKYLELAQRAYSQEIVLYQERTEALDRAQGDWLNGAMEALQNYYDETRDVAKLTEDAWTNAFKGLEDTLTTFITTGKADFKGLANSVLADLNRMFVKEQITGPLAKAIKDGNILGGLGGLFGGGTQPGAPVEQRSIAAALNPVAGAAGAVDTAAFTAAVATSGATFSTEVIASGTAFAPEIIAAGASFSAEVIAAGASFAASVAAASASSAAGSGIASAGASVLGSFASGIDYIPKTGIYQLHEGERVVPKAENGGGGGWGGSVNITQNFPPGTDRRTVNQAAAAAGSAVQRAMARNT